ncbi:MAG: hypothetical protein JSR77_00710 [Planctomycetes bacterium]|nr:hypothetical protein [Planctomycetota bacterium]
MNRALLGLCSGMALTAAAFAQAPANDLCSGAIDVSAGPFPVITAVVDITNATTTNDPSFSCQSSSSRRIWYKVTPTASGNLRVASCTADAPLDTVSDTVIAVYTGDCATNTWTQIGCSDDACSLRSNLTVPVNAGTTYYILAGKFGTGAPTSTTKDLQLYINPPTNAPTNPTGVGSVAPTSATNCGDQSVLVSVLVTPGANPTSSGLQVEADLSSIGGSNVQALNDLGLNGDAVAGDGRYSFSQTVATGTTVGAQSFNFIVRDAESRSSNSTITGLTVTACPPPPNANETCASAIDLTIGTPVSGYTTSRGTSSTVPSCGSISNGIMAWYRVIGTGNTMTASTCDPATNHDTVVGVFCGVDGCGALSCIGSNDDAGSTACSLRGTASIFSWCSVQGAPYYVAVRGFSANIGNFGLTVTDSGTPCTGAIACGQPTPPSGTGSWTAATVQNCGDQSSLLVVRPTSGAFPPSMSYTVSANLSTIGGSATQALNDLGTDGDVTAGDGNFSFRYTVPDTVAVAAYSIPFTVTDDQNRTGNGVATLNVSQCPPPPPENDNCAGAIDLNMDEPTAGYITPRSATVTVPFCGVTAGSRSAWYKIVGNGNTLVATTDAGAGTLTDTLIQVFCATNGCSNLGCIGGDDDSGAGLLSTLSFCSQNGAEYYVVVSGFSGGTGTFRVAVNDSGAPCTGAIACVATGACCLPDSQTCEQLSAADCEARGGTYQGDNVPCSTSTDGTSYASGDSFPISIPDFVDPNPGIATSTDVISGSFEAIQAIKVCIGLTHTFPGDLIVDLSNSVRTVRLLNRQGGSADVGGTYCFDSSSTTPFTGGAPGTFAPFESLAAFAGDSLDDTWTLTVSDNAGLDVGTIDSFSITSQAVTPTCSFCPACAADYNQDGGVDGADVAAFFADWENSTGCADVSQDGGVDGADVDFFYQRWEAGGCN